MRYINKLSIPSFFVEWVDARKRANQTLSYDEFNNKAALNESLRSEQKSICCYCQRQIDHFKGGSRKKLERSSHNEHLYPQSGHPKSGDKQMDYYNLFASCSDTSGQTKKLQCCGEHKGNLLIREFIKEVSCKTYFKYNVNGEIVPNGRYTLWDDYKKDNNKIGDVKDAFECIKTLNLNCQTLVESRKECIDALLIFLAKSTKEEVKCQVQNWLNSSQLPDYLELRLQFVKLQYPDLVH